MKMLDKIKFRHGAKFISDVNIPDESWKADFDIADRYQSFANELMRISLLGIAGYGFLIKEIWMKKEFYPTFIILADYLWAGAIFLGISLSLVLAHRFFSTSCLYYQVLIMRSLRRLENPHWTEKEKENETHFLKSARDVQRAKSRTSHFFLVFSAISFAIGFFFVIIVFYSFLQHLPEKLD